jgi:beta-glucuronidase
LSAPSSSVRRPLLWVALLAGLLLAAVTPPPAGAADGLSKRVLYRDGHTGRLLLGGAWLFRRDAEDAGLAQGLPTSTATEGWSTVQVPHTYNAEDYSDESQRGTVTWYRKDFRAPRGGGRFAIRFEAVNFRARVWLNGREIGSHTGDDRPFDLYAPRLRRGVNHLVVRVDNRHLPTDFPPVRDIGAARRPSGGWWNYNGILREVYLRRIGPVDLKAFGVRPILPCRRCPASAAVRLLLRNPGRRAVRVRPTARVAGRPVALRSVVVPGGRSRSVGGRVALGRVRLWEPGSPRLYRASASAGGTGFRTHFGVRSIKVDRRGRMLLNGRRVRLRGASVHEEAKGVGAALGPGQRATLFRQLRASGARITRAHYPLHPHFLEMADRAGMLVWEQIPFYQLRNDVLAMSSIRRQGLDFLADTIRRDYSHPSIIAWSVGNELGNRPAGDGDEAASAPSAGLVAYIAQAAALSKRLDPSRLAAYDISGYPDAPKPRVYRRLDALGLNSYFGWYPGPGGQLNDRTRLGPYLDAMHRRFPRLALFVTEFGAEANRSGPATEKGTFEFQRDFLRFHLGVYNSRPFLNGAIIWALRDFKVRPAWNGGNPKPDPPFNRKGLIDTSNGRKPAFVLVRQIYRRINPLR